MLSFNEARRIGMQKCVDMLGRDFVKKNLENSSSAYGEDPDNGLVYCFLGLSTTPLRSGKTIKLTSDNQFPYQAYCFVRTEDGTITDEKLIRPCA